MKNYFLTLGFLVVAGVAVQPALADSFYLEGTNISSVPCSTSAPCAEVTITTSGDTATFTVSSLDNHFVFDRFGFNFTGAGTLTLTTPAPSGEVGSSNSLGGSKQEDGWGSFDYTFNTGKAGGSDGDDCVVTAGLPGTGCTFTFTVTDASTSSLTPSEFESATTSTNGTGDFAGHLAQPSGGTGFVGDSAAIPPVPEPSSLALLGSGVLGLAGVVRRRFKR